MTPALAAVAPAPRERTPIATLQRQTAYFTPERFARHLLDALPTMVLILNRQHEVVLANRALLGVLGQSTESAVLGQRPGEILNCIHVSGTAQSCGTAEACRACGGVQAVVESLRGVEVQQECRLTRRGPLGPEALELRVKAVPMHCGEESFTLVSIEDISAQKRQQALEKIFFHDLLNVAGGIRGYTELLQTYELHDREEIFASLQQAALQLIDEIEAQRTMVNAERGELQPAPAPLEAREVLERLVRIYQQHDVAEGRTLAIDPGAERAVLVGDPALLVRVLGNLVKNALEAVPVGGRVTVSSRRRAGLVVFSVHNPQVISEEARLQIFQRSFTTKGFGRGLGTYSARLLAERYLGGEVSFHSNAHDGTCFELALPLAEA